MESPKEAYQKLQQDEEFKKFHKKNSGAFLSSFALMGSLDELKNKPWHINFYVPETKKMTSFIMSNPIGISHEQDILKKGKIKELKLNDLKVPFEKIYENAKIVYKEKKEEDAQTVVIIVQKNDEHTNWTITFVSSTMKMLSVTLNAETGEIVQAKQSNFSYKVEKKS